MGGRYAWNGVSLPVEDGDFWRRRTGVVKLTYLMAF